MIFRKIPFTIIIPRFKRQYFQWESGVVEICFLNSICPKFLQQLTTSALNFVFNTLQCFRAPALSVNTSIIFTIEKYQFLPPYSMKNLYFSYQTILYVSLVYSKTKLQSYKGRVINLAIFLGAISRYSP